MTVFLSGWESASWMPKLLAKLPTKVSLLASFLYLSRARDVQKVMGNCSTFMIDSGAHTVRTKALTNSAQTDMKYWYDFVDRYGACVNMLKPDIYVELDIDRAIGYKNVKKLRKRLQKITQREPLVVWHRQLGFSELRNMCKKYKYIGIGGMGGAHPEIESKLVPLLTSYIRKQGCLSHGFGYTPNTRILRKSHFDSVDSSSWSANAIHGRITIFSGTEIRHNYANPYGLKWSTNGLRLINFLEWYKFQLWAANRL